MLGDSWEDAGHTLPAPKKGTRASGDVLVYQPGTCRVARLFWDLGDGSLDLRWESYGGTTLDDVTHWRRLPPPPKADE